MYSVVILLLWVLCVLCLAAGIGKVNFLLTINAFCSLPHTVENICIALLKAFKRFP